MSDSETMVKLRNANQEYLYTMNTLMGLHKAQANSSLLFVDVESDHQRLTARTMEHPSLAEKIAATVWAGRYLGLNVPAKVMSLFRGILESAIDNAHLSSQGLAWAIAACAESGEEYLHRADDRMHIAEKRYISCGESTGSQPPEGLSKRGYWTCGK